MAWISRLSPCRCYLPAVTVFFVTVSATAAAQAQTWQDPSPKPRAPATWSRQSKPMKPCPAYGPGFVQVPGSDLCIKIGGSVQVDVGR
jgi:porin-like protein